MSFFLSVFIYLHVKKIISKQSYKYVAYNKSTQGFLSDKKYFSLKYQFFFFLQNMIFFYPYLFIYM
jgi:hypothetical protein